MLFSKLQKHPFLLGTAFLTVSGLLSRLLGFFYRIFLSQTIGATGLGLYQLIFPIFTLGLAICSGGIQTAISRFVAESEDGRHVLYTGLGLSILLSLLFSAATYLFAEPIAICFLKEEKAVPLLQILALSFLPAAIHSCFNGYYYGRKKSLLPSLCQIGEQAVRVGATLLFFLILQSRGLSITPLHIVWALVASEAAGLLILLTGFCGTQEVPGSQPPSPRRPLLTELIKMALPLTLNQVLMTFCHSLEHLLLPQKLVSYGFSSEEALGHFGILSGMAMSVILFPAVLSNSLSVLLLPRISEARSRGDSNGILDTIRAALCTGLTLGSLCTLVFLLGSHWIGEVLFHSTLAGFYIQILSILCPFLYTCSLLGSITNGLGLAGYTLICNLSGCLIRILSICFFVPIYGMHAYIFAMIVSEIVVTIEFICLIRREYQRTAGN